MKKQILALMACAAFLSPISGFCMENKEDKSRGALLCILPENNLQILDNLEPIDVAKMKFISRDSYGLVKKTKNIFPLKVVFHCDPYYCNRTTVKYANVDYDKICFNLFFEEEKNKRLISLGNFNMTAEIDKPSTVKKIIVLPNSVKRGIFLAELQKPHHEGMYRDLRSCSHISLGRKFNRFIHEENNKPRQEWMQDEDKTIEKWKADINEFLSSLVKNKVFDDSPSAISDNSKIVLKIMTINLLAADSSWNSILVPRLEYFIHPTNGSKLIQR